MKIKMKNNSKWMLLALVPILASCANQQSQMNSDLSQPVSVVDVKKGDIIQYINTTGTATVASQVIVYSEMAGNYNLGKNSRTGTEFK